jgi:heme-degrading monooxygenase HmoA
MQNPAATSNIARLWEHPQLCIAIFGLQLHDDEARIAYAASGVQEEMIAALEGAHEHGLLHNRLLTSAEGPILMQYWRSHEDLHRWSRQQPHARWWQWVHQHATAGLGFYHEVYQTRTAEAIYLTGCLPVGPAAFCTLEPARADGASEERQRRFAQARTEGNPREGDAA